MKRRLIFSLVFIAFISLVSLLLLALCCSPRSTYALDDSAKPKVEYGEIRVSVTIGEPKLTIWGYTSPGAEVGLEGRRVSEETTADQSGYFHFDNVLLVYTQVFSLRLYPQLHLTSIDKDKRVSYPTYLPRLPQGPYTIEMGPVILPPTISLGKGSFLSGEQVAAQGRTLPNTKVEIAMANEVGQRGSRPGLIPTGLVPTAWAYFLPRYEVLSDPQGNFQFSLPSVEADNWRIFAYSYYDQSPSAKSVTLNFQVLNWWQSVLYRIRIFLIGLLALLYPYRWPIIIVCQFVLVYILLKALSRDRQDKSYFLWNHRLNLYKRWRRKTKSQITIIK